MTITIFLVLIGLVGARADASNSVTVNEREFSRVDLSKVELSNDFCVITGQALISPDIAEEVFASTASQCRSRCRRNMECRAFQYGTAQKCQLLKSNVGDRFGTTNIDFYSRKLKGGKCQPGSIDFVLNLPHYTRTFCHVKGKKCAGSNLYPKPLNINTLKGCAEKCERIRECGGFDFINNMCQPKGKLCVAGDLVGDETSVHSHRLVEGEKCPGGDPGAPTKVAKTTPVANPEPEPAAIPVKKRYNKRISVGQWVGLLNKWPRNVKRAALGEIFPPPVADKMMDDSWGMDSRGETDCWLLGRNPPRVPCPPEWT